LLNALFSAKSFTAAKVEQFVDVHLVSLPANLGMKRDRHTTGVM